MALGTKAPSMPVITSQAQLEQMLLTWRNTINRVVRSALPAPPPYNFKVTQARGGLLIEWGEVHTIRPNVNTNTINTPSSNSDGYHILISKSGDFVSDVQKVKINDIKQTKYFHTVGGPPAKYFVKIHTTSGTSHDPQSVHGMDSGIVSHISLDMNDTTTVPSVNRDNSLTDKVRSQARFGRYLSK